MCAVVAAAYCLLSSNKKGLNNACCGHGFVDEFIYVCGNALKYSNVISSIDTDLFPPLYYDFILLAKIETTLLA